MVRLNISMDEGNVDWINSCVLSGDFSSLDEYLNKLIDEHRRLICLTDHFEAAVAEMAATDQKDSVKPLVNMASTSFLPSVGKRS